MTKMEADYWWLKRAKRIEKRFRTKEPKYYAAKPIIQEMTARDNGRFEIWLEACHTYTRKYYASE